MLTCVFCSGIHGADSDQHLLQCKELIRQSLASSQVRPANISAECSSFKVHQMIPCVLTLLPFQQMRITCGPSITERNSASRYGQNTREIATTSMLEQGISSHCCFCALLTFCYAAGTGQACN